MAREGEDIRHSWSRPGNAHANNAGGHRRQTDEVAHELEWPRSCEKKDDCCTVPPPPKSFKVEQRASGGGKARPWRPEATARPTTLNMGVGGGAGPQASDGGVFFFALTGTPFRASLCNPRTALSLRTSTSRSVIEVTQARTESAQVVANSTSLRFPCVSLSSPVVPLSSTPRFPVVPCRPAFKE